MNIIKTLLAVIISLFLIRMIWNILPRLVLRVFGPHAMILVLKTQTAAEIAFNDLMVYLRSLMGSDDFR